MLRLRLSLYSLLALFIPCATSAEALQAGDIAPNWILMDSQGETVSLYQEAEQGRATVMIFCASWCKNCQELLPEMNKLSVHHREQSSKVVFYVMNVWENGDPTAYVKQRAPSISVVLRADHIARRYAVEVTPGVVVVGPDRRILYQRAAGTSSQQVALQVEQLLSQASP